MCVQMRESTADRTTSFHLFDDENSQSRDQYFSNIRLERDEAERSENNYNTNRDY